MNSVLPSDSKAESAALTSIAVTSELIKKPNKPAPALRDDGRRGKKKNK